MGVYRNCIIHTMFVIVCVYAQDYFEDRHKYQIATQMGHLKEIQRRFEVKGENAVAEFKKYINDIQSLARKENVTISFKIKVEAFFPKQKFMKKDLLKKIKTKKYNVPLKKKNMKLSNFEIVLRKRANEFNTRQKTFEVEPVTTEKRPLYFSTRSPSQGKYRPIVSHVKTNYTKIVRPVRNKVITLFV
ncbi:uncharacterized protein [Epargyreus clarus]|uniref:uncharacterized protein n=1 Tax=Epargyreus clarus TaxID=520877 RepID=UPI003C30325B